MNSDFGFPKIKLTTFAIIIMIAFGIGCSTQGESETVSVDEMHVEVENPVRISGLGFEDHRELYLSLHPELASDRISAMNVAVPYAEVVDTSNLTPWLGTKVELFDAFQKMRDEQIYEDPEAAGEMRRATWLHPYNGCFARAGHASRSMERQGYVRPGQIFAFGDLSIQTPYHPGGKIGWWFHVAAAYRIGNEAYVLDPSLDPYRPLKLADWIGRLSRKPSETKVSFCDRNAYIPASPCVGGRKISDWGATKHLLDLLPDEKNTLHRLGFNVDEYLGEAPPWRSKYLEPLDWVLMLGDDYR